jgi:Flp pilus assembly protein TadD
MHREALIAVLMLVAPSAGAQTLPGPFQLCADSNKTPDDRIAACTSATQLPGMKPHDIAMAYNDLGLAQNAKGRDQLALDAFGKALSTQPDLWEALINRGFVYLERSDIDSAAVDYARAANIKFAPTPTEDQAQHDDAITQLHNGVTKAYGYRCRVQATQSQALDSALAACNIAAKYAPGVEQVLESRGLVHFRRGDLAAAKADFDAALVVNPKSYLSLYVRGLTKLRAGDKDGAEADIAAAKDISSDGVDDLASHGLTQ